MNSLWQQIFVVDDTVLFLCRQNTGSNGEVVPSDYEAEAPARVSPLLLNTHRIKEA